MIPRYNDEVYPVIYSTDNFKTYVLQAICSTHKDAKNYVAKLNTNLTEDEIAEGSEYTILCMNMIECKEEE